MVSFVTRMPAAFPGLVTRDVQQTVIEMEMLDTVQIPLVFGAFVKTVAGKIRGLQSGDTASLITGAIIRPYPSQNSLNAFGAPAPIAGDVCSRLRAGYFAATCTYGAPTIDGTVYVRVAVGGVHSTGAVGDIEATSDTTYNVVVPGAFFTGSADSNGVAEIRYGF